MNTFLRNIGIWLVIGLIMLMLFNLVGPRESNEREISFSEFISQIESGSVLEVIIRGSQIHGVSDTNGSFQTQVPNYPALFKILDSHQVRVHWQPSVVVSPHQARSRHHEHTRFAMVKRYLESRVNTAFAPPT